MAAPTNRAVWQDAVRIPGVVCGNSHLTHDELGDSKVVVKVHAWTINPCNHMLQDRNVVKQPITAEGTLPDCTSATRFCVGDRVFGLTANDGSQNDVASEDRLMARIADDVAYREVVVLGLCSATSATFLFGKDYLHLDHPKLGVPKKENNAIQLATAVGYDAIATCLKNSDFVKGLGVVQTFDTKDTDVTEDVAVEHDEDECAGIFVAAGLKDGNVATCKVAAASKQMSPSHLAPIYPI